MSIIKPIKYTVIGLAVLLIVIAVVLSTIDFNQYKGLIAEKVKAATGRELTINGNLHVKLTLAPTVAVEDVTFANASWAKPADMVTAKRIEVSVRIIPLIFGELHVKNLSLIQPTINLATNAKGQNNWDFDNRATDTTEQAAANTADSSSPKVEFKRIDISDANVNYVNQQTNEKYQFHINSFIANSQILSDDLDVMLDAKYNEKPLNLTAEISHDNNSVSLSGILFKLGQTNLKGNMSLQSTATKTAINADLTSSYFALADFLPNLATDANSNQTRQQSHSNQRLFSPEPLPLAELRKLSGTVKVSIDDFLVRYIHIKNLKTQISFADGVITADPMQAVLADGQFTSAIKLNIPNNNTANADLTLKANNAKLGVLLADFGLKGKVDGGNANIDINLRGRGNSVQGIMSTANGRFFMDVAKAKLDYAPVDLAGANFMMSAIKAVNPFVRDDGATLLNCGVINFVIKDGMATTERGIALDTNRTQIIGSGTINLKTEALQLDVRPQARAGVGLSGADLAQIVRIGGTLSSPGVEINPAGVIRQGASIAAAVSTGGISSLAQGLLGGARRAATNDDNICQTARDYKG